MDSWLRSLLASDLVSPATRRVLEERLSDTEGREQETFEPDTFETLVAAVDVLRPPYPRPTAVEIALEIDRRLSADTGDGWRYDGMPPDREAYIAGLRLLQTEASACGVEGALERIRNGLAAWPPLDAKRFLEELLVEVTEIAYSHPEVQIAIGYVGFADAQGWRALEPDGREAWE